MGGGWSMAYPPMWGSPLPYPPHYDILTGQKGGTIPSMKFSGKIFGKRGSVSTPTSGTHNFPFGNIIVNWGNVYYNLYRTVLYLSCMKRIVLICLVLFLVGCKTTHQVDHNTVKMRKYNKCFNF